MHFSETNFFYYQDITGSHSGASLSISDAARLINDIHLVEIAVQREFAKPETAEILTKLQAMPKDRKGNPILPSEIDFRQQYIERHMPHAPLISHFTTLPDRWAEFNPPGQSVSFEINGEKVYLDVGSILPKAPQSMAQVHELAKSLPEHAQDNSTWTKDRLLGFVQQDFQPNIRFLKEGAGKAWQSLTRMHSLFDWAWRIQEPEKYKNFVEWLEALRLKDVMDIKGALAASNLHQRVMFTKGELLTWVFSAPTQANIISKGLFEAWKNQDYKRLGWTNPEVQVERNRDWPKGLRPGGQSNCG